MLPGNQTHRTQCKWHNERTVKEISNFAVLSGLIEELGTVQKYLCEKAHYLVKLNGRENSEYC